MKWLLLALLIACQSVPRHDPLYDGVPDLSEVEGDSVTYVPIHVENHRTRDPIDPHFFIVGQGVHPLGIIKGFGGSLDRLIDTRWLGPDGSFTIRAHYAGGGTFTFDTGYWKKGERIDVTLDNIFIPTASWSHR